MKTILLAGTGGPERLRLAGVLVVSLVAGLAAGQPVPGGAAPLVVGGPLGASLQEVFGDLDASALGPAAGARPGSTWVASRSLWVTC